MRRARCEATRLEAEINSTGCLHNRSVVLGRPIRVTDNVSISGVHFDLTPAAKRQFNAEQERALADATRAYWDKPTRTV